jgi:hypothetical protein
MANKTRTPLLTFLKHMNEENLTIHFQKDSPSHSVERDVRVFVYDLHVYGLRAFSSLDPEIQETLLDYYLHVTDQMKKSENNVLH